MNILHHRRLNIAVYLMVFTCLCDQLSKAWVLQNVTPPYYTPVTSFLNLVLVHNTGVTFGLLNHFRQSYVAYGLIAVAAVVVFFLGRWLLRTTSTLVAVGLGLIIGGAVGNVIDRVRYGSVTDFLDFYWHQYHWYAFNVADAAIVTGVCLLLLDSLIRGR